MKAQTEKKLVNLIIDLADHTAKNTVGKSIPLLAHEVKIPEKIRKDLLQK